MDKMLVDSGGSVVVTNDGVTILKEMDIDHPAANMIVEVSETQEEEVGDGTTSAVVVAGELLDQAEELLDQDIHATTLAQGYRQAAEKAKDILEEEAIEVSEDDRDTLVQIAETAMTGKGAENSKDLLAELVVDSVLAVQDDDSIDTDNVSVEKVVGSSIDKSELVEGVIVDKERVDENMPFAVEDADVALFDGAIEVKETEIDAEVNVTDPDQLQQFDDQEEEQLREMVDHLVDIGADVVFVGDGIDDMAQHYLARAGGHPRRPPREVRRPQAPRPRDRRPRRLQPRRRHRDGRPRLRRLRRTEGHRRRRAHLRRGRRRGQVRPSHPSRGGTEHVVDEVERAIEDSLGVVRTTLLDGKVLPGGGAPEAELALQLRDFADSVGGGASSSPSRRSPTRWKSSRAPSPRTRVSIPSTRWSTSRSRHDAGEFGAGLDAYTGAT